MILITFPLFVYETIKELEIDRKLRSLGFNGSQLPATFGVIAGRMIVPGFERATHYWMQNFTVLDELMGVDFSNVSLNKVYKVSDLLLKHRDALEEHLRCTERQLFGLEEKIILYDLTNSFFEGSGKYNPKARYGGNSKEKRNNCPLVTLGLAVEDINENSVFKPTTIVLDAGIATEDNIKWLKDNLYHYIVVFRKKKKAIPSDVAMIAVREDDKTNTVLVQAGLVKNQETDELELYCHSIDKEKKEEGIKNKFQERFEVELLKARNALDLKNGTKRYDKVIERIGRLKEKFKLVSHGYKVLLKKTAKQTRLKMLRGHVKKPKIQVASTALEPIEKISMSNRYGIYIQC